MSTRTQYYCATSLDGFIAEADDNLDWLTGYNGTFDGPGAEPCVLLALAHEGVELLGA